MKAQCEIPNESNRQILSYMYEECEYKKQNIQKKLVELKTELSTVS